MSIEEIQAELASLERIEEVLAQYQGAGTLCADWEYCSDKRSKLKKQLEEIEKQSQG